jgi:Cytochrome P460
VEILFEGENMPSKLSKVITGSVILTILIGVTLLAQQRKSELKVPGGLGFSEFNGYESWQLVGVSYHDDMLVGVVGNPAMIEAFNAGIPENGKPFPDGAKMAKVHWAATKFEGGPGQRTVPGAQLDIDFMVKDSKRFADSGGWAMASSNMIRRRAHTGRAT